MRRRRLRRATTMQVTINHEAVSALGCGAKGPRMAKSVDDRGRGARLARRDEGAYCWYVTEEQRSQPGCVDRESDRLSHSRALRCDDAARPSLLAMRQWFRLPGNWRAPFAHGGVPSSSGGERRFQCNFARRGESGHRGPEPGGGRRCQWRRALRLRSIPRYGSRRGPDSCRQLRVAVQPAPPEGSLARVQCGRAQLRRSSTGRRGSGARCSQSDLAAYRWPVSAPTRLRVSQ